MLGHPYRNQRFEMVPERPRSHLVVGHPEVALALEPLPTDVC